jgi:hypothetical protein
LSTRERLFCVLAYLPKATVQAALGGVALAQGLADGERILALAVLSILFTAPLGLIAILAPRPRRVRRSAPGLYASDPYSDIELGRSAPTHPSIETRPTAQYGPPFPDDPLRLPPPP